MRSRSKRLVPLAFLAVPLLLGAVSRPSIRPGSLAPIAGTSDRAALTYAEAAAAIRGRDCAGAVRTLSPLTTTGKDREAAFAKLLTGLYAHACEQEKLAEEHLFQAADPNGILEDWRLFLLSDAAAAQGHVLLSQASLARLIGDHPASPLRPRALVKAATVAWERQDVGRALELIDRARRDRLDGLPGEEGVRLERLAWEIGNRTGNEEVRREAARRLLTEAPSVAAELQVIDIFRPAAGDLDWSLILTPEQLKRRARALLDLKLDPSSTDALDAVPMAARDVEWYLLKAQVLTRAKRGADALQLLAGRNVTDPRLEAQLEWERAQAAAEMATAQRGRKTTAAERKRMRQISQQHLQKVARSAQAGADPELAAQALRSLWSDQVEDDRFDEAMATLRRLQTLDPSDTTGAAHLWSLGWREYGKKNYSGAVGYWTELVSLYPNVSDGRRGRYWTARAFEALGETERAQQIYREVASSDTTDLYRKNALARLDRKVVPPESEDAEPEPWPADPQLARARLLTDLGLEDLAQAEMELVDAEPRSRIALEALILARKGERRKSILVIRDAFPALGTPHQARLPEEALRLYYPLDYQETIRPWAQRNGLPTNLVYGIIRQESAFDPQAQSWAGARGLMQLMPATARELAGQFGLPYSHEKLSDPDFNIRLGTTYFSRVLDMFEGNQELALAGYNGGPYRIKRWWREWGSSDIDRFLESLSLEESRTYVKRITVLSDSYRQLYPQPAG